MAKTRIKRLTHPQRAKRRVQIARAVKGGASIGEVMKRFRVSGNLARTACRENGVKPPGRINAARRAADRYKAITKAARTGAPSSVLMERFGVSRAVVYEACHRLGVKLTRDRTKTQGRTNLVLKLLRAGRQTKSEIARRVGLSQQRISQIAQEAARGAG
jgi:transposase